MAESLARTLTTVICARRVPKRIRGADASNEDAARNRGPGVHPVVVGRARQCLPAGCLVLATTIDEALLVRPAWAISRR